jgi:uncharacterized membrane protein (UPF0127 family)
MVWHLKRKIIFITGLMIALSGAISEAFAVGKIEFKKIKIQLNAKTIEVELANTDPARTQGLMFRKSLAKDSGMLFVFPDEQLRSFWMKNTFVPLTIGYFDAQRKLVHTLDMAATTPTTSTYLHYSSLKKAKYALEMSLGWFKNNSIKDGTELKFIGSEPAGL